MIISDTHRFAFVHIPKCAGSSVRHALAPFDDAAQRYFDKGVSDHPGLGRLDHAHIPLSVLQSHFADDFAKLQDYASFAILRDPYSRFPSSLHERFTQRDRKSLGDISIDDVAKEVDQVLTTLSAHPKDSPILDPGLIHFSRQRDYIYLNKTQVVDNLYTTVGVKDLLGRISEITGTPIRTEVHQNNRYYHRYPLARSLQTAVTQPIERLLPRKVWKPVFTAVKAGLLSTGMIRTGGNPLPDLPNTDAIQAFVAEFYADDIALYQTIQASTQATNMAS